MSREASLHPTVVVGGERLGLLGWVAGVDHKVVGALYLIGGVVYLLVGGVEALVMRAQLARSELAIVDPVAYNQLFTMHGTTMIFLAAVPLLLGLANYFVPLMIGAREVAFPRLNAFSFWLYLFGGALLNYSFLTADAPDVGWFGYAPLTARAYSLGAGVDYWALAMILLGASSIAGALNLAVTILLRRCPGMSLTSMPLFVWTVLVQAVLILGALPALTGAALLLLLDRQLGAHFFDASFPGSSTLWQHLFWFFGHPEVYIVILPAFGMISEIVPVFSRKPIFGYAFIAGSSVAIMLLSFMVWAHHMFAVGLSGAELVFFSAASMLIAIPTGVKVLNWVATMWGGTLRFRTPLLFSVGFIAMFVIGGLTGVSVAVVPFDWQATDSYYVVAHLHYVLFGGTVLAVFAGIYYWFPKMTGRLLSERLGRWHFWLTVAGLNLAFLPQHWLGLQGMPRRVYTYAADAGWDFWNVVSTVGAFLIAAGTIAFAMNVLASLRRGALAGPDPWDGWTLEWSVPSPPPPGNFAEIPAVRSRRPLWDRKHPEAPDPPRGAAGEGWIASFGPAGWGVLIFVLSEAVFFGAIVSAYVAARPIAEAKETLDLGRTALFSVFLFASSFTITRAAGPRGWRWVAATWLLGAIFLVGQATEYWRLITIDQLSLRASLFGSGFFALTGLHGLHVLAGLVALAGVLVLRGARPAFAVRGEGVTHAVSIYWHFVDVVWIVVFSVVYLWTLL